MKQNNTNLRKVLMELIEFLPPHEGKTFEEALADHLIANGIIALPPVKTGDTLFFIMNDGKIYSGQVCYLHWDLHKDYGIHSEIRASVGANSCVGASFEDFGKTVFFTKEEAEHALKGC